MDEVASAIDDYREIEDAIGQVIVPKQMDDDDLEKELDELMAMQKVGFAMLFITNSPHM